MDMVVHIKRTEVVASRHIFLSIYIAKCFCCRDSALDPPGEAHMTPQTSLLDLVMTLVGGDRQGRVKKRGWKEKGGYGKVRQEIGRKSCAESTRELQLLPCIIVNTIFYD